MPLDPSIIAAIETAVKNDPDNVSLRMHLVSLLLESERYAPALEHALVVLAAEPDHRDALGAAARAAAATGDTTKAERYRRLYEALGGAPQNRPQERRTERPQTGNPGDGPYIDPVFGTIGRDEPATIHLSAAEEPLDFSSHLERSTITLADVAGMEQVKRRLNLSLFAPLKDPSLMKLYGRSMRGGLLLYGPPGCGKTFIARAVAGELGAHFIAVGLSDVLDMYLGQSERNLHEIFETARRNSPTVIFFDEVDALGRKRSLQRHGAGRDVVNQFLAELDSVGGDNTDVFVLAATNHPWDVDTALRRPGRFDRMLVVLPPDRPAREAMLRYHTGERPTEKIDFEWIANRTEGYSGADLAHLCDSAAELAMEDSIRRGIPRPIRQEDFKAAMKEVKPSTRAWMEMARNYATFANEGGAYDDLIAYMKEMRLM